MGVAFGECGIESADGQQLGNPLAAFARVRLDAVDFHGLADDLAYFHARIERAVGVLENDLNLLPYRDQALLVELVQVDALEDDVAGRRVLELQDAAPRGGLAAARFAHQPEGLTLLDLEADVVDGLHVGDGLLEHDALEDREVHLEVPDLDERLALLDLFEA